MGIKEQLENEKRYYQECAWQFFRKKEKLPKTMTEAQFNNEYKGTKLYEKLGAFRHIYTSSEFTRNYGEFLAALLGNANELVQLGLFKTLKGDSYYPGNEPQDRRMDLKNNAVGREIAKNYTGNNLLNEVYSQIGKNPKIITNQYVNNDEPYNGNPIMNKAWALMDWGYENREAIDRHTKPIQNAVQSAKKIKNYLENLSDKKNISGFAADLQEGFDDDFSLDETNYEQPMSFRERLLKSRQEKLARYTQKLAQTPEEISALEAKHVTLAELKAPQDERKQKLRNIIEGKVEFDENADFSSYENKKSGDNKIFTQEDIDEMSEEEREENKAAIFYQKQTIGVPTREQAEKSAANGGMIHVEAYTRKDGTKVKSYYRSR